MESVRLLIDIPKSVYEGFINNCYTRNDMIAIHNSIMHAQKVDIKSISKELGLPCSRSEIFEEISKKI